MIYVDDYRQPATVGRIRGRWSHLVAWPPNVKELEEFGKEIGLKPEWLQHPTQPVRAHFDVTEKYRRLAIANGAKEESAWKLARWRLAYLLMAMMPVEAE